MPRRAAHAPIAPMLGSAALRTFHPLAARTVGRVAMTDDRSSKRGLIEARDAQVAHSSSSGLFAAPATCAPSTACPSAWRPARTLGGGRRVGLRQVDARARVILLDRPTAGALDARRQVDVDQRVMRADRHRRCAKLGADGVPESVWRRSTRASASRRSLEDAAGRSTPSSRLAETPRQARRRRCWSRSGCGPSIAQRYPHMFSGGQRQRIAIARALDAAAEASLVCR